MGFDEAGVRRRGRAVVMVLVVFVCVLALPAVAAAETFEVNDTGDQVDAAAGDEFCLTAGGKCTLRAAVDEANALAGSDVVRFDELLFGGSGATIALDDPLTIGEGLSIEGTRACVSGATKPCVGIDGPAGEIALTIQGASSVEIERLALTDAEVGISVENSTGVKVFGSWFGVEVDGDAGSLDAGLVYGPDSDGARIGQPAEGQGNLFANIGGVALDLFGASGASVYGNRFGVGPDGHTPARNGEDIEVTSDTSGGVDAVGNEIGARVEPGLTGGPCDEWCNLISGATGIALDLQGEVGEEEGPAVGTSVAGNYFGLTADGAGSAANAGANIRVGAAERTVIGGAKDGDANRFSGGAVAVEAGPGAPDLVIRGNRIGLNGLGQTASPPSRGIDVDSNDLASVALEAILAGNELRMAGGTGILQQGFGAWIFGNEVSGAATGIRTIGASVQGNLIEGNSVSASGFAIVLENDMNDVVGNRVTGAGGAGIAVRGEPPFGVSGNVIGGDLAGEENEISGATGPAIAIESTTSSITTVLRNRGAGNTGLFVDLLAASPSQTKGPNDGIVPPSILSATGTGVIGLGEPGATVRVFRKQTALAGEIAGYLGAATVDGDGNWALSYAAPLSDGTAIAAGQTSTAGGSSELAIGTTKGSGLNEGESGGNDGGGRVDKARPRTAILKGPRARSTGRTASFKFASDETGTRFQCRLDRKPFRSCSSPHRYGGLRPGKHVFAVRAIDRAGNVESTPAKRAFTVLGKR